MHHLGMNPQADSKSPLKWTEESDSPLQWTFAISPHFSRGWSLSEAELWVSIEANILNT